MSDPFANLLSSFKNGNKTNDDSKSLNPKSSTTLSSQWGESSSQYETKSDLSPISQSDSSTPSRLPVPMDLNGTHDDMEDLFGLRTSQALPGQAAKHPPVQDDFDAAFSAFKQSPEVAVKDDVDSVVDEVRDMEVAKLMSLGYSIERANASYEKGILYEDVVRKISEKKANRPSKKHALPQRGHDTDGNSFASLFDSGRRNDNLFSMASELLSKGKQMMDQFTTFPEEQDRMSASRIRDEERLVKIKENQSHATSGDSYNTGQPVANAKTDYSDNTADNQNDVHVIKDATKDEECLIDQFEEKVSITEQAPEETLLDFGQQDTMEKKEVSSISPKPISHIELSGYNEFKNRGSEFFKNGDYISALEEYKKSLNTLPIDHPLRIIAYSNIIASRIKIGEYNKIIQESDIALKLFPDDSSIWTEPIQDSQPSRSFKDIWPKLILRQAESFEHIEKFPEALNAYQSLMERNFFDDKIMEGKRRCQKILNPQKPNSKQVRRDTLERINQSPRRPATGSQDEQQKVYESVQKLKEENQVEKENEAERARLYDQIFDSIEAWKSGKGDDIRYLLSNLSSVLTWCDWKPIESSDLVMPRKVKIAYMKAVAKTHPDKLSSSLGLKERMMAENIFSTLGIAWEKFKEENKMN